jgi:polyisoprenyl-phosphate glycosyltransferase
MNALVIVIPVFNDWHACSRVVAALDAALAEKELHARLILVDDGSPQPSSELAIDSGLRAIEAVDILALRRNVGHQRAIGVALAWIERNLPCDAVVVMDGDGEDDPLDVPRLVAHMRRLGGTTIVFAERTRRSEGLVFRSAYALFKLAHRLLTGKGVRVGNFSVVPYMRLRALVSNPDLWNHYAASIFISRVPFDMLPTSRASRLAGRPTMNFLNLVNHGLSAIAVFSEIVSVRVLIATLFGIGATILVMFAVLGIRLFTTIAVPGWATYTMGLLLLLLVQGIMFSMLFSFSVLANRKSAAVILSRDFELFVDGLHNHWRPAARRVPAVESA